MVVSAVHRFAGPGGVSPASVHRDGNTNRIDAARAAKADVVLVSGVGAAPDSPMELFRMKHAAATALMNRAWIILLTVKRLEASSSRLGIDRNNQPLK